MPSLVIRPARIEDRSFLVEVMRLAATSHLPHCVWDVLFGLPAERVDALLASLAVSEKPHWCHLSRFHIAEREGERVGALSGFEPASEGTDAVAAELLALVGPFGLSEDALARVRSHAANLQRGTPPPVTNTWGIENVAVLPKYRGGGVVDALLDHVFAVGADRGCHAAQVLSLNGNTRAERTWLRHGFEVVTDYRDRSFEQVYGTAGMRLYLRSL